MGGKHGGSADKDLPAERGKTDTGETERGWMNPVGPDPFLYPDPPPQPEPPASGTPELGSGPVEIGSGTVEVGSGTGRIGSGTADPEP